MSAPRQTPRKPILVKRLLTLSEREDRRKKMERLPSSDERAAFCWVATPIPHLLPRRVSDPVSASMRSFNK